MFKVPPVPADWADQAAEYANKGKEVSDAVRDAAAEASAAGVAAEEVAAATAAVVAWATRLTDAWSAEAWAATFARENAVAAAEKAEWSAGAGGTDARSAAIEAEGAAQIAASGARDAEEQATRAVNDEFIAVLVEADNAAADAMAEAVEAASAAAEDATQSAAADLDAAMLAVGLVVAAIDRIDRTWESVRSISNALYQTQIACASTAGAVEFQKVLAESAIWSSSEEHSQAARTPKRRRLWR